MSALKVYVEYSVLCDCCGYREATELKKAATYFKKVGWVVKDGVQLCLNCQNNQSHENTTPELPDYTIDELHELDCVKHGYLKITTL